MHGDQGSSPGPGKFFYYDILTWDIKKWRETQAKGI
jgi:hypothetical protein